MSLAIFQRMFAQTFARAGIGMAVAGTLGFVALALGLNWAAALLGVVYGVYQATFAGDVGGVAAPSTDEVDRISARFRDEASAPSVGQRRIQAAMLAVLGFALAGFALAGL